MDPPAQTLTPLMNGAASGGEFLTLPETLFRADAITAFLNTIAAVSQQQPVFGSKTSRIPVSGLFYNNCLPGTFQADSSASSRKIHGKIRNFRRVLFTVR